MGVNSRDSRRVSKAGNPTEKGLHQRKAEQKRGFRRNRSEGVHSRNDQSDIVIPIPAFLIQSATPDDSTLDKRCVKGLSIVYQECINS